MAPIRLYGFKTIADAIIYLDQCFQKVQKEYKPKEILQG